MDQIKKNNIAYAELLNRCWDDQEYKSKFFEDPATVLQQYGIETVPGARYHIVEPEKMQPSTPEDIYLPFTPQPKFRLLDDQDLTAVASGDWFYMNSNVVVNVNATVDASVAVETGTLVFTWGVIFTI